MFMHAYLGVLTYLFSNSFLLHFWSVAQDIYVTLKNLLITVFARSYAYNLLLQITADNSQFISLLILDKIRSIMHIMLVLQI